MNATQLLGRLTRNVELRYLENGTALAQFTLAVQRSFKNKEGEYEADFIRCKSFGKTGEVIAQYVKKGQQLIVEGSIQTGSYEKEGIRMYTTDVMVNRFTFVEKVGESSEEDLPEEKEEQADPFKKSDNNLDISDDDLPF